jgi:hypothetical protein
MNAIKAATRGALGEVRSNTGSMVSEAESAVQSTSEALAEVRDDIEEMKREQRRARRRARSGGGDDDDDGGGGGGSGGYTPPSTDDQYGGARPPGLQSGGIVTADAMPAILHGPEAVMPLDKLPALMADAMRQAGGGGSNTVNIRQIVVEEAEDGEQVVEDIYTEMGAHL